MKIILYFIQSLIVYIFFLISKIIGLKLSRLLFSYIFKQFGSIFRSKKIIFNNLETINSNISTDEKKKISEKMWSNYGKTFIEYAHLKRFKKKSEHITIKNKKILDQISNQKKPVIFISGHFANYELMSMEIVKSNIKLATIYRPLNNFFLNPFMEFVRRNYVCKNQIKKGRNGVRDALNYLKKNYSIALMVDQRVSEGTKIPFFNKNAFTTTLPAQLSKRFGCEIIPIYINRINKENFEMEVLDPISVPKNNENYKIQTTKKINEVIEKLIVRDPSQWILTHNRWK